MPERHDATHHPAAADDGREAESNRLSQHIAELDAMRSVIVALDRSLMMRFVRLYWRLVDRLLPAQTRRRRVYAWCRVRGWGILRMLRRARRAAAPSSDPSQGAAPVPALVAVEEDLGLLQRLAETHVSDTAVVIFSGTELREDEGQRPTQIALELARRGVPVVFGYHRWERGEWLPQDRLVDGIAKVPLDVLTGQRQAVVRAFPGSRRIALFCFPHPSFFATLAGLNGGCWITLYDVLDDWEEFHRVGQATWYDRSFEEHLVRATDAVFSVNAILAERMHGMGAVDPIVVPNGLRQGIEVVRSARTLERGEVTVGYFGYLSAAWFDWDLVANSARSRPSWRFYVIGYGVDPGDLDLPENVRLLGRMPQMELASYAANWDVAIIPFKPERLAEGADPIKCYEYLAMGLPVVVTGVSAPVGAERLVRRVEGEREFVAALEQAAVEGASLRGAGRQFAARNTWGQRVDTMLEVVASGRQRVGEKLYLTTGGGKA